MSVRFVESVRICFVGLLALPVCIIYNFILVYSLSFLFYRFTVYVCVTNNVVLVYRGSYRLL